MKRIIILLLFLTSNLWGIQNPWDVKLPFERATIYYQIKGMQKGSSTLYIKNYGKVRAEYKNLKMKFLGITNHYKTLDITTPQWIYNIDLINMKGTKRVNPQKYLIKEFNKLSRKDKKKVIKNIKKYNFMLVGDVKGKVIKNAKTILGYKCDKIILNNMTIYNISGTDLILKSSSSQSGMNFEQNAIKIIKGYAPDNKFKIPSTVKIKYDRESDKEARLQAKKIIKSLIKGKIKNQPFPESNDYKRNNSQNQRENIKKLLKMFGQ